METSDTYSKRLFYLKNNNSLRKEFHSVERHNASTLQTTSFTPGQFCRKLWEEEF